VNRACDYFLIGQRESAPISFKKTFVCSLLLQKFRVFNVFIFYKQSQEYLKYNMRDFYLYENSAMALQSYYIEQNRVGSLFALAWLQVEKIAGACKKKN